jgi:hypothetical protein
VRTKAGTPQFSVKVVDMVGIERIEHPTTSRDDADVYARTAIEDGCRSARVIDARSGFVLSTWSPDDFRL